METMGYKGEKTYEYVETAYNVWKRSVLLRMIAFLVRFKNILLVRRFWNAIFIFYTEEGQTSQDLIGHSSLRLR